MMQFMKNADLFASSNLFGPGCFGPLFVNLSLLPCFAYTAAPCTVRKLDDKLRQMQLLEGHRLAFDSTARAINQSLQQVLQ